MICAILEHILLTLKVYKLNYSLITHFFWRSATHHEKQVGIYLVGRIRTNTKSTQQDDGKKRFQWEFRRLPDVVI